MFIMIPTLPLIIILAANTRNLSSLRLALVLAVFSWPFAARVIRSQVLSLRERPYVELSKMTNLSDREIITGDILPNMAPYVAIGFAQASVGSAFALDVNVQRKILATLAKLRDELNVAIMIVSHDLPVHAQLVDRIAVMYAGQVVEAGDIRSTVKTPLHPYARGLMNAIPSIGKPRERLEGIKGSTPSPLNWPPGCRFHNRCPHVMDVCQNVPPLLAAAATGDRDTRDGIVLVQPGREVACHLYPESTPKEARQP